MTKETVIATSNEKETKISRKWMEHGGGRKEAEAEDRRQWKITNSRPFKWHSGPLGWTRVHPFSQGIQVIRAVVQLDLSPGDKGASNFLPGGIGSNSPPPPVRALSSGGSVGSTGCLRGGKETSPQHTFLIIMLMSSRSGEIDLALHWKETYLC